MIYFNSDYVEGAHPLILNRLIETNFNQTVGYGEDEYCENARNLIKNVCGREDIDVHFLVGGTQANTTVIASILKPYQAAVSTKLGHINVHETGAIEATGHKVIGLDCGSDGKLSAKAVEDFYNSHWNDVTHEHQPQPKLVYISNSTENGAVYKKSELKELSNVCKKCGLYLFLDGARLGYALASPENDLSLNDLCEYCDVFYIGGTKVGALFGEAVVIVNPLLKQDFRYNIKQRGGMLAKGRLLGLQFETLFTDELYFKISEHAIKIAFKIAGALKENGIKFLSEPISNQIFPIFTNEVIKKIEEKYVISFWEKVDEEHSAIRICTSWATKEENADKIIEDILNIIKEK